MDGAAVRTVPTPAKNRTSNLYLVTNQCRLMSSFAHPSEMRRFSPCLKPEDEARSCHRTLNKSKIVPLLTVKASRGSRDRAPPILKLGATEVLISP